MGNSNQIKMRTKEREDTTERIAELGDRGGSLGYMVRGNQEHIT